MLELTKLGHLLFTRWAMDAFISLDYVSSMAQEANTKSVNLSYDFTLF